MDKVTNSQEWLKQSEYDIGTAQAMLESGRYIYSVFMCHLSLEKILKASYVKKLSQNPPKSHSLVYLAQSIKLAAPAETKEFLESLDEISIPTRYPEELDVLLKEYDKDRTQVIFNKTKEALEWLKKELQGQ